jgi:hypothetical protein
VNAPLDSEAGNLFFKSIIVGYFGGGIGGLLVLLGGILGLLSHVI